MILFTGLTGTSGSALIDVLIRNKFDEKCKVIVRESSDTRALDISGLNFEKTLGTIDDELFLQSSMEDVEIVFHIAAKNKIEKVAKAAAKSSTVKQCIFVSSTSIYSQYRTTSENLIKQEQKAKTMLDAKGITFTFIRPTMIFGTLNDHNVSIFMRIIDRLPLFPIVKHGEALLQPVSCKDLAESYYLILKNRHVAEGKEYIVSGDRPITLLEMFKIIEKCLGRKNYYINIPFWVAQTSALCVFCASFGKIDFREKLLRLTEDRNFEHSLITEEFAYNPLPFEERLKEHYEEYFKSKTNS
ncbi:MAG: NAD-dependent epimerase/dehydratase family protein [Eubacteriales bacterium]